eukprot:5517196-Pyramimonas_sp.AAC.1
MSRSCCVRVEHAHDLNNLCVKIMNGNPHHVLAHASTSKSFVAVKGLAKQIHTYLHSKVGLDEDNRNDIAIELEHEISLVVGFARAVIADAHRQRQKSWQD